MIEVSLESEFHFMWNIWEVMNEALAQHQGKMPLLLAGGCSEG